MKPLNVLWIYVNAHAQDTTTRLGTAGGTALTIFGIYSSDILKTMALAAIGATVSFSVSLLLNYGLKSFVRWINRK